MTRRRVVNPAHNPWTPEEDALVLEKYRTLGHRGLAPLIPNHSPRAIKRRLFEIGGDSSRKCRRWTRDEKIIVEDAWGRVPVAEIAKRVHRTPVAVYFYARYYLRLCGKSPQGMETLTAAADRTGYDTDTLRRILHAAHKHIFRPSGSTGGGRGKRFVEPPDVDEAVLSWLATENVGQAAERRGLKPAYLRCWLRRAIASGLFDVPPMPARNRHWRVATETIDRVLEWESTLLSAAQISRRSGVSQNTLGRWFAEAGLKRLGKRQWFLTWEDARRAIAAHVSSERTRARLRPGLLEAA